MVNNFEQIKSLLKWESQDDFYFLQILQRKKDHVAGKVNGTNNNSRLIKAYYVKSLEHLEFIEPEVIELCKLFNARAGINLNKRSFQRMALQHLKKITDQLLNKSYNKAHKAYASVVGAFNDDSDKKWIIDIDKEELIWTAQIKDAIVNCNPDVGQSKVLAELPSKSGLHLITKPFDVKQFQLNFKEELQAYQMEPINIEIHKNNPTNIYCL